LLALFSQHAPAPPDIYPLSLHDALPIYEPKSAARPTGVSHSWCIYLLPYLEQDNLYKQYNFNSLSYNSPGITTPNPAVVSIPLRSEEHTSELQSRFDLVCRLLLEKKKKQ